MSRDNERLSIQEVAELTGSSLPTIYRRLRQGEIRGVVCIDANGKHLEIYKRDLPKLVLKKRRSTSQSLEVGGLAAEVETESPRIERVPEMPPSLERAALTVELEAPEKDSWKVRARQLEQDLEIAKDEAAYWRGRWEEVSANYETLRQILVDKNAEDQEEIWSLRSQVADLQERLESPSPEVEPSIVEDDSLASEAPALEAEPLESVPSPPVEAPSVEESLLELTPVEEGPSEPLPSYPTRELVVESLESAPAPSYFIHSLEEEPTRYPEPVFGDPPSQAESNPAPKKWTHLPRRKRKRGRR